tara:strand:- start:4613 stop:5065 length:453 start_codon:yes stop_codon:yes gene_type:complete
MGKDYEVGYGKPPKETRFKKGKSGNPKGRPSGTRNFKTDLLDTLKTPVQLKEKGRVKTVSTQQAALLRLREKALGGDARALDRLIELARIHNDEDMAEAAAEALAPSDRAILEGFAERMQRRGGTGIPPDDAAEHQGRETVEDDDDAWLR